MTEKPEYIIEEEQIEKELTDFKGMAAIVGMASARKQRTINVMIFGAVVICFFVEIFHPLIFKTLLGVSGGDYIGKAALAIAVFLISLKLGYYLHNAVKFNHYTFWVFASLESRLLEIKDQLRDNRRRLEVLAGEDTQNRR